MQKKWLVGTMAATMMLAACTTGTSNDADPGGNDDTNDSDGGDKILIVNNGAEPVSLDPQIAFESVSSAPLNNIMEGLMRLNADHVPEEATAERYEVSEDGLTYTFYLRENANWSNGDPVTAEDFEYAWKRLVHPDTGSPAAFLANLIEGATEFYEGDGTEEDVMVTALDEKTLEVVLNSPQQYFLNLITNPSFFPVHKDTVEENGSWHQEASTYVGNGPFTLTGWDHNTELRMTRNNHYWDAESVELDGATWLMLEDQNTAYSYMSKVVCIRQHLRPI